VHQWKSPARSAPPCFLQLLPSLYRAAFSPSTRTTSGNDDLTFSCSYSLTIEALQYSSPRNPRYAAYIPLSIERAHDFSYSPHSASPDSRLNNSLLKKTIIHDYNSIIQRTSIQRCREIFQRKMIPVRLPASSLSSAQHNSNTAPIFKRSTPSRFWRQRKMKLLLRYQNPRASKVGSRRSWGC
jgi:hypothetical protein